MDPLASLQRIDPYIYQILMAASRVRLYKYIKTEWKESNIEGSFFVYERKCEPCFGFMILNQLSETNEIQPITKDSIELHEESVQSPFLFYKKKESYHCIWFSAKDNCRKLFQMIELVINNLRNPDKEVNTEQDFKTAVTSSGEEGLLQDLLNNAKRVFDYAKNKEILAATQETSPSIGERLLSISEQQNGENKENGGNNEAFFPQVAGNATAGPQPPELLASLQTQMDPSKSLFTDPASGLLMPPLPEAVKSNYREMSILDLLTDETVVKKVLSFIEQQNDENKEDEASNAAFLAQVSQAGNATAGSAGPLHPEILAALQPRMKSLLRDPAVISVEALENQNHEQSKPLHQENSKYNAKNSLVSDYYEEIPSEQDGGPGPAFGSTSAATAPIPVPVEVKIELRQDDSCFSELNEIMENVLDLEKQVDAFQGEKDSKEYKFLDEMLTRNLLALDEIGTSDRDDVRQQRKESVNSLNGFVCFNKLNKMKSLLKDSPVISVEALENQNHQQSKLSHQLEHDGSPDPASGPTSAATAPIPVPLEVKIKLRPDDPCFSKLNKIMENFLDLEKQIDAFQGEKDNKEYKFLDEMLTRNLLALDGIETAGRDDVRQQRKEFVNSINRCVRILESKAKTKQEEKNNAIWSDLAQSTGTEIISTLIRPVSFLARSSQAGNNTEGLQPQGLPAAIQPQIDPLTDPVAGFFAQASQTGNNTEIPGLDSVEVLIRKIGSETNLSRKH